MVSDEIDTCVTLNRLEEHDTTITFNMILWRPRLVRDTDKERGAFPKSRQYLSGNEH